MKLTFRDFLNESNERQKAMEITVYSITNDGIIPRDSKYLQQLSHNYSNNKIIRYGDIVFGNSRHTLNYGIFKKNILGSVSSAYKVFRINCDIVTPEFLDLYLRVNRTNMLHIIKPGARDNQSIDKKILFETEVNFPKIKKQKHVTNTFDAINNIIELMEKIVINLELIAQKIYKSWFIDFDFPNESGKPYKSSGGEMIESEFGLIPKGWNVVEFKEFFDFAKGKKPKKIEKNRQKDFIPYLTLGYINKYEQIFASSQKCIITSFDETLMVMDGGSSGSVYYGLEGILASTFSVLKSKQDKTKMFILFTAKQYEDEIRKRLTGSAIPHTDKEYVNKLTVITNIDIAKKFEDIIKPIIYEVTQIRTESVKLKEKRDELLPKLIIEEIEVPFEG